MKNSALNRREWILRKKEKRRTQVCCHPLAKVLFCLAGKGRSSGHQVHWAQASHRILSANGIRQFIFFDLLWFICVRICWISC